MSEKIINRDYDLMMKYCQANSEPTNELMHELERTTYLKTLAPQMISGAVQGQLLTLFCQTSNAKTVLEVGTFTGYATICLAKGIHPEGKVHTIEINKELGYISKDFFERSGLSDRIVQHWGDAKKIIPTIDEPLDIVFLDGAKVDYPVIFEMLMDKIKPGGLLIVDNVLWSGKVAFGATDKGTKMIDQFNKKVNDDPRVTSLILPMRDGLMVARKV